VTARRGAACAASGALLALAFPPTDWQPLALVALTPLLWLWRDATPREGAAYGSCWGAAFFVVLLRWMWHASAVAYLPVVVIQTGFVAALGLFVPWFRQHVTRSPVLTAAAWVVAEQLRARVPWGGFSWGEAGVALHDIAAVRALASWGGVALVSFMVVAWNGLLVDVIAGRDRAERTRARWAGVGLVSLLGFTLAATAFQYQPRVTARLRIAMLQGNDKNRRLTAAEQRNRYLPESHFALADRLTGAFDIIVFPESALDQSPEQDLGLHRRITDLAAAHRSSVLVNAVTSDANGRRSNTNFLYSADGVLQDTYTKQHLVPFGEYVPLRRILHTIVDLDRVPHDYARGREETLFPVSGHRIGTVICFESAFSPLVDRFVRDGAEMIVITTNNRSFGRSGNAAQHLAISQMRSAETARPILQASISGHTAVIAAGGEVHDVTRLFVNAAVVSEVALTRGETPFVRYESWLVWLPASAILAAVVLHPARRRRRATAQ
jgi:apolipoprotein N-acyltransferase